MIQQKVDFQLQKRAGMLGERRWHRNLAQRVLIAMGRLLESILPVQNVAVFEQLVEQQQPNTAE